MTTARGVIPCTFPDRASAERAVTQLRAAGFSEKDIGFMWSDDNSRTGDHRAEGSMPGRGSASEAGELGTSGALTGVGLGGIIGAVMAGLIPGVGIVVGGLIAGALAGAATGAAAGGVTGALLGMGIPEDEANAYAGDIKKGGILVTVNAAGREDEARRVLDECGCRSAVRQGDRVEMKEERLAPKKVAAEVGEVRVGKRVVTEEQQVQVPVTREEASIERHPVPERPASGPVGSGGEVRVPLRGEEVKVDKQTVTREEVSVGKTPVTETKTVRADVRKEDPVIEREEEQEASRTE